MSLLAIDPGKNTGRSNQGTGWAVFDNGKLTRAGKSDPRLLMLSPKLVVIEQPRWYPKEREVDTNDLLDLAVLVGRYAGYYERGGSDVELFAPRDWKGTLPPHIMAERIVGALTREELALVPRRPRAKDIDHNISDAIGIGLHKLRRLR